MTQSALSQNVKKLEHHYGVELFERRHGRVDLTGFGEVVVASARQILQSIRVMQKQIEQLKNLETGRIAIGVDPYFATSLIAPILADLMVAYPSLKFSMKSGSYTAFESEVQSGATDAYIGMPPHQVSPALNCEILNVPTPLILCPADHPLAKAKAVTLEQALKHRIVTSMPPTWYIDWVREQLGNNNEHFDAERLMILDADNIEVVKSVALKSNALMAALYPDVEDEVSAGKLKTLTLRAWPKSMQGCIITSASRPISPATSLLVSAFRNVVSEQVTAEA